MNRRGTSSDLRTELEFSTTSARLLFIAVPYTVLLLSAAFTLADPHERAGQHLAGTLGLVVLAAAWLSWAALRRPSWPAQRVEIVIYYSGLLVVIGALLAWSPMFAGFVLVGYAYALALLPAHLLMFGVGATAAVSALVPHLSDDAATSPYTLAASLTIPILIGGWFVSVLNARRNRTIMELERANTLLADAMRENAHLHSQLLVQAREAGVSDERQRMAHEIHDTLAQGLAGILAQLEAGEREPDVPEPLRRRVATARGLARQTLTEARRSVQALRPDGLVDVRLPQALAKLTHEWSESSGVPAAFEVEGDPGELSSEVEVTLYRVAQEALANVVKHAHATRAGVMLTYLDDVVLLDVRDDGQGFGGPGEVVDRGDGSHFGLRAMRQRVERVGGELQIETAEGVGTTINASIPAAYTQTEESHRD